VNIDISEIEAGRADGEAGRDAKPPAGPRRSGFGLAFLALLIALAALLGAGWMWWQGQSAGSTAQARAQSEIARLENADSRLSVQLQELRETLDARPAGDVDSRLAALQSTLSDDQARVAALQQSLQEQVALTRSMQTAVDAMHSRLVAAESALAGVGARELDARGDLDLAEVDYLLRLATERLQLFSDPRSADRALALADTHLAALENPAYLGVRQAIAAARRELAALDLPDDLEIAGQLESIQRAIPSLPFRPASPANSDVAPVVEGGWWQKLKSTVASLVTVRRSTGEESRRISLQDKDYIRQRLWLQLEAAYLALMQHEQQAFRAALLRVRESLAEWFDPASSEVAAVGESLDALLALEVAIAWPDISEPWNTLRLVRAAQSTAKAAVPVQLPEPPPADAAEPGAVDESGGSPQ